MRKQKNGYLKMGLTVFLTVSAILLAYDTFFGHRVLIWLGRKFITAIKPVLYGAMMAYLLAPLVNRLELLMFPPDGKRPKGRLWQNKGAFPATGVRAISVFLTWMLVLIFLYVLGAVLLPEVYRSIWQLMGNIEGYYQTIYDWVEHLLETNPELEQWAAVQMDAYYADINSWLTEHILPQAQQLMTVVSGGIVSALTFLKNLLVGVIVSIYLLATKERVAAQGRKILYSVLSRREAAWMLRAVSKTDSIFSGFVRGKLLDSLIIGVLCFIGCSLFHFPYTPLVSVFVGVTNVIPFFGPFLGAIPSALLILLDSPVQALYFIVFALALQQLDGNVIGPKILGDKTGLSSLGVITAILVGGTFFGVPGMFFGVPVCACLHCAIQYFVNYRLHKQNLPVETDTYSRPLSETEPLESAPAEEPKAGEKQP